MTASANSDLGGNIGIGFAIPASLTRPVTDELRSNGRVTRGYLGVTIQPVTPDIAQRSTSRTGPARWSPMCPRTPLPPRPG